MENLERTLHDIETKGFLIDESPLTTQMEAKTVPNFDQSTWLCV